jgi:hypothetical protein
MLNTCGVSELKVFLNQDENTKYYKELVIKFSTEYIFFLCTCIFKKASRVLNWKVNDTLYSIKATTFDLPIGLNMDYMWNFKLISLAIRIDEIYLNDDLLF